MRAAAACLECELGCPVTSDLDIFRAVECPAAGDMEGEAVWLRIVEAVEELLSEERPDDTEVH